MAAVPLSVPLRVPLDMCAGSIKKERAISTQDNNNSLRAPNAHSGVVTDTEGTDGPADGPSRGLECDCLTSRLCWAIAIKQSRLRGQTITLQPTVSGTAKPHRVLVDWGRANISGSLSNAKITYGTNLAGRGEADAAWTPDLGLWRPRPDFGALDGDGRSASLILETNRP